MANPRIAIIGAGNMAREHLTAFRDIEDCEVVAIASRRYETASALARRYGVLDVCKSIDEVFDKHQPDGLVVAVSETATFDILCAASRYPWSILVEKPAGCNYAEAFELTEVFRSRPNSVFVALNRRHYSSTRAVLDDLQSQGGTRIVAVCDQEDPDAALAAGRPLRVVENWMYANSIHLIDFFSLFCRGHLEGVENIVPWRGLGTNFVLASLQFSSGDIGVYSAYWNRPAPWSVSVSTPGKRWELRPIESASAIDRASRVAVPYERSHWDTNFKPGIRLQAAEFVSHLTGKKSSLATLEDSLVSMAITSKIYAS